MKAEENKNKPTYPCLMKSRGNLIVLFERHGSGTVVSGENKCQPIGHVSDGWIMQCFEPFNGTVTLSND